MAKLFLLIAEIFFLCIAAASSDSADIFFLESFDTAGVLFKISITIAIQNIILLLIDCSRCI